VHRHRSAGVGVRWRTASWRESDFEAEDAFVGGVDEFVLVHYLESGEWRALREGLVRVCREGCD
jgi:hypothetical protein